MPAKSHYKDWGTGFIIGFAGGVLGGLVGLGGGIVMVPLMTWLAKLTQHRAHGTSLVAIVFTGLIGSVTYFFHGYVDWKAALILAVSAMLTARFGALYAHSLPEKKLRKAFGLFLVFASLMLVLKGTVMESSFDIGPVFRYTAFFLTGITTGFASGMMGVGGGGIMIPFLVILAGMPQHLAQGTSLLAMVPGSAMGSAMHYRLGNVVKEIVPGLVIGAAIGGYSGAAFAHLVPDIYLKVIFSLLGLWMGVNYIKA